MITSTVERDVLNNQLSDEELSGLFLNLYVVARIHEDTWTSLPRGFQSPVFKYPRPGAILRGKANIRVYPESPVYPTAISLFNGSPRKNSIYPAYEATIPTVDSDGVFNVQRGMREQDRRAFGIPLSEGKLVAEGDPERLIVQSMVTSAIEEFSYQ